MTYYQGSGAYHPDADRDWPAVPIADYRDLPLTSGIYACIVPVELRPGRSDRPGRVLYVGQSTCIRERWVNGHHRAIDAMVAGATHIAWMEAPPNRLDMLERLLIEEHQPALNAAPGPPPAQGPLEQQRVGRYDIAQRAPSRARPLISGVRDRARHLP